MGTVRQAQSEKAHDGKGGSVRVDRGIGVFENGETRENEMKRGDRERGRERGRSERKLEPNEAMTAVLRRTPRHTQAWQPDGHCGL